MGFRCPFCKKDFGTDHKTFKAHLSKHEEPIPDLNGLAMINSCDSLKKVLKNNILGGINANKN